jgi:hypothetical protein
MKKCSDSGLFTKLSSLIPSSSGSNLPRDCQDIDDASPDYTKCFKWIVKNLIRNSMLPKYNAIFNIQSTIIASQSNTTTTLRYLQDTEGPIVIVKADDTASDSSAAIEPDFYEVNDSDTLIDGTSGTNQADLNVQIDEFNNDITTSTSIVTNLSSSYIQISLLLLGLITLLI